MVTLRGKHLHAFLDLFITLIMPKRSISNHDFVKKSHHNIKQAHTTLLDKSINFGVSNFLEFPQLEPFFPQFESIKGFNINITVDSKNVNASCDGPTWIWGF